MESSAPAIRTREVRQCHACGGGGDIAYVGLRDRLFGVPGEWTLRRCRDPGCGMLWLDPMPIEEDLPRLYENYYTHENGGGGGHVVPTMFGHMRNSIKRAYWCGRFGYSGTPEILAKAVAVSMQMFRGASARLDNHVFGLRATPGGRLLEIGSGSGSALLRMGELGWRVEGVDFDEKAVSIARGRGLDVRSGTLEQQNFLSGSFDAVVMSHVIEHVPNPRALLQECHRVLKPGGHLICFTPNARSWCHRLFAGNWLHLDPPRHLYLFTTESLRKLARRLEWADMRIDTTTADSHGTFLASRSLCLFGRHKMGVAPTLVLAIVGRVFQMIADVRQVFDRETGEEIVLRARR